MSKLIVVTGGTKGIGRAIAERFAEAGFNVAVCARKVDELEKFKADLTKKHPSGKFYTLPADMAEQKSSGCICQLYPAA
jgi:short-subunit dehydrogenase